MRPMLTSRGTTVPTGDEWVHEVKWDGMRVLADVTPGSLKLLSRNENDVTVRSRGWEPPHESRAAAPRTETIERSPFSIDRAICIAGATGFSTGSRAVRRRRGRPDTGRRGSRDPLQIGDNLARCIEKVPTVPAQKPAKIDPDTA